MKNPLPLYRLILALLNLTLLFVALAAQRDIRAAKKARGEAEARAVAVESRLRSIERGVINPQGTRKVIAAEVKADESILVPELDGDLWNSPPAHKRDDVEPLPPMIEALSHLTSGHPDAEGKTH